MQKWLEALITEYLQAATKLADTDEAGFKRLAVWMKDQFAAHGAKSIRQQRNPMTEVRSALREKLGPDHLALQTMNFSSEEWIEINSIITQKAAMQNESQVILSPDAVNALITRATQQLLSRSWADVAAGLAVLTGRRSTEILKTASFTLKSPYSVVFTGALKRKGESTTLSFEIPTLCQAEYVVTALLKLRSALSTETMTPKQVNQFADDVCAACNRHFADLVPAPQGRESLYTHLFRKIYATAATYFYCPENVDEAEFRAHIQGHFSGHENLSLAQRRTIASDRHYRSYSIQDDRGNMRKGVRLGNQGVEVVEVFSKPQDIKDEMNIATTRKQQTGDVSTARNVAPAEVTPEAARKRSMKRPELPADLLDQMMQKMAHRGVKGSYADVFEVLLQTVDRLQAELSAEQQKNSGGLNAVAWFTKQVDTLQGRLTALEKENELLKATQIAPQSIAALKEENARLNAELKNTQSRLESIQQLLSPSAPASATAVPVLSPIASPAATAAPVPGIAQQRPGQASANLSPTASAPMIASPSPVPATVATVPVATSVDTTTDSAISRNPGYEDTALDPDIERALFAVFHHNRSVDSNTDRWTISIPMLKDLLKQIGKSSQYKIQDVLQAYSHAIDSHHAEFLLSPRHNRVHKNTNVSEFVRLDR